MNKVNGGKLRINTGGPPPPDFGPGQTVRLACAYCEESYEAITPEKLETLRAKGWAEIQEIQSFEDSKRVYDDLRKAPAGYSVLDWFTHLGICPDCLAKGGA